MTAPAFPDTLPFRATALAVFARIVEAEHSELEIIDSLQYDEDGFDPDDIRCHFSDAICSTMFVLGVDQPVGTDPAEWEGAFGDLILEAWTGLDKYFIDTTDKE